MNVQVRDTPASSKLGQRLRQAREAARYSRTQLSAATSIPSKSIEKFEAGEQEPSVSRLIALANTLGVSLDHLLGKTATSDAPLPGPGNAPPDIEEDPVGDLLAELDELRGSGFQYAQRRAMALVDQLTAKLNMLEPRELIDIAQERGVDMASCPSVLDLQNALSADAGGGQAVCGEVEQRVIDTALLGADLPAVEGKKLVEIAARLKVEGGGFFGWSADDKTLPTALREPLRRLAYAGKAIVLDE